MSGLTAEVLRNALIGAAEEASLVVVRAAHSTFIVEGADAAAGILTADGRLVAHSVSTVPMQGMSLRCSLPAIIQKFPDMRPDDVFATNDVYRGGIHANDLIVVRPVFAGGEPAYFTGTLIHIADLSGLSAGGMAADATDVFLEGLQLPPVRLTEPVLEILAANSRSPEALLGDVRALMAGANVAARRLEKLIGEYGVAGLAAGIEDHFDHAEGRMRRSLGELPRGSYDAEYPIDGGPTVRVRVDVAGDGVHVDFAGTDPQVALPMNAGFSQTMSGMIYALRCHADPSIPLNEGSLRPITFAMPEGSLVNVRKPYPGGGRFLPVAAAVEAVFAALGRARRERAVGASGVLQGFSISAEGWLHMGFELGGEGARWGMDGVDATGALFGGGRNMIPQAEPIERRLPVRIEERAQIPGSGGTGRWSGGRGVRLVIRLLRDALVDTRGDRLETPPKGALGGGDGRPGGYWRLDGGGARHELSARATRQPFAAGEALVIETSGGGGLLPPSHKAAPTRHPQR